MGRGSDSSKVTEQPGRREHAPQFPTWEHMDNDEDECFKSGATLTQSLSLLLSL